MNCNNLLLLESKDGNYYELRSILEQYDDGIVRLSSRYIDKALRICAEGGHDNCIYELLKRGADVNAPKRDDKHYRKMNDIDCDDEDDEDDEEDDDDDEDDEDDDDKNDDNEESDVVGSAERVSRFHNEIKALTLACGNGHFDCTKLLIMNGSDVNNITASSELPIIAAAKNNRLECLKLLIENGCDIDKQNDKGFTGLLEASRLGRTECIKLLLEAGASLDTVDYDSSKTLLHWICYNNYCKCIDLVLPYLNESQINSQDDDGCTPLMYLARNGCSDCIEALLNVGNGVNVNATSNDNSSAIIFASLYGNLEALKVLCEEGGNANIKTNKNGSPLHCSVFASKCSVIKYLLDNTDIDIQDKDNSGTSPLMYAVLYNRIECLKLLIDAGANPNDERDGLSALAYAARRNFQTIISLLVNSGADINFKDEEDGLSVLHYAAQTQDNLDCICLLIELGADRTALTKQLETFDDLKDETYDENFIEILEQELQNRDQNRELARRDENWSRRKNWIMFLYHSNFLKLLSKAHSNNLEHLYYDFGEEESDSTTIYDTILKNEMIVRKIGSYL